MSGNSSPQEGFPWSAFSAANALRAGLWHEGFPFDEGWSLGDWGNALAGEVGELCNVVKKIRRVEAGLQGKADPPLDLLLEQAGDEIGDVYAYLDLLATKLGLHTPSVVARKFNAISRREGFAVFVEEGTPAILARETGSGHEAADR